MTEPSDWKTLAEILEAQGIKQECVYSLLECIDAPDKLIAFRKIAENLHKVLGLLEHIVQKDKYVPETVKDKVKYIDDWREICAAIVAEPEPCVRKIPDFDRQPTKPDNAPLVNNFRSHGLYVTLWYSASAEELEVIFNQLLAQVVYAFLLLRQREYEGEIFESNKYDSLRSARNLLKNLNSNFLAQYPSTIDSLPVYLNRLRKITDNPWVQFHIVLFHYATKGREGITRDRERYSRPAVEMNLPIPNRDPEQIAGTPSTRILQMPALDKNEERELLESGCCAEEGRAAVELMSHSYPGRQPMDGRTPSQHLRRMRSRAAQIACHNQLLPYRWENLSLHDVAHYIAAISDVYHGSDNALLQPDRMPALELAAFLSAIFWICCPLKKIRHLKLYSVNQMQTATGNGFVYRAESNGHWMIKPAKPTSSQPLTDEQRYHAIPVQEILPLESGLHIEKIIKQYIEEVRGLPGSTPRILFDKSGLIYYRALSAFIAAVNQRHNCRLTPGRLSDHMLDALAHHPGSDLVSASLITGRYHYLAVNPLHYTALPVSYLQKIYRGVCGTIAQQTLKELGPNRNSSLLLSHGTSIESLHATDPHVGSHYRPGRQVVKNLIDKMQSSLDTAKQKSWGLEKVLRLHNNLTLYTSLMFGFATGFRAVREPFFIDSHIDRHTGLALISDKDNGDFYNARIVWLPPHCIDQYDLYQSHIESLKDRMLFLNYDLFKRMHGYMGKQSNVGKVPLLFFFDKDRNETVLRPAILQKVLKKVFTLPINANRHYVQSYLSEQGCPHHVVSAFMGHWERGQEPWGRFSALSPLAYRGALEKHLLPLLQEDGWRAMPGLGKQL